MRIQWPLVRSSSLPYLSAVLVFAVAAACQEACRHAFLPHNFLAPSQHAFSTLIFLSRFCLAILLMCQRLYHIPVLFNLP